MLVGIAELVVVAVVVDTVVAVDVTDTVAVVVGRRFEVWAPFCADCCIRRHKLAADCIGRGRIGPPDIM